MQTLSSLKRTEHLDNITNETFDLLVIGGGITGAGIALDAATRGLNVILLEKNDYSWGTSSRSTKLIHGGLRYLKQFEIALVHEVGTERAIVYQNARHIVIPEKMLLPIVDGGSLGKFMSSLGLWVYDFLAGVKKEERRRMLSKQQTITQEPLLRQDILNGGGLYYEYRSDDSRLTLENLKTAAEHGAHCFNYTEITEFCYDSNNKVSGVKVQDHLGQKQYVIKAKMIVNAAGPWVDNLRKLDIKNPEAVAPKKTLHLTKGVHLVVKRERLNLRQSAYFDVLDGKGRMVFAIPRGRTTYIGTTDTNYQGETDRPVCTKEDAEYVLKAANEMFPTANLQLSDVISTWAGLRPLIHEAGKDPSELSRKDEIFTSSTGLISIAGGKLTGYRKMSEKVVNLVCKTLGVSAESKTKTMQLSGGKFDTDEAVQRFTAQRIGEVSQINLPPQTIIDWVQRYGTNTDVIIEKAYEWAQRMEGDTARLARLAEMWYTIHYEMTCTLNDFLIRRTGRLYFERDLLVDTYVDYANDLAELLGWDEARKYRELAAFKKEFDEVLSF